MVVVAVEGGGYGSGSDTASRYGMTSGCDDMIIVTKRWTLLSDATDDDDDDNWEEEEIKEDNDACERSSKSTY